MPGERAEPSRPADVDRVLRLLAAALDVAAQEPRWAHRLEVSYLPRDLLARAGPPAEPRPYFNGGRLWDPDPSTASRSRLPTRSSRSSASRS